MSAIAMDGNLPPAGRKRHRPCFLRCSPKGPFPTSLPRSPILACSGLCAPPGLFGSLRFSVRHYSVPLTSLLRPSLTSKNFLFPAPRNLSFLNITFHHGGIRTVPDLRHNLRDHKPVRPSRSLNVGSCQIRLLIFATSRYTDLQPVGMGAFGLVWYVVNRVLPGPSCRMRNVPPLTGR